MYIESIRISDFKGIRDLEFEPGGVNIITGPNNSGKTSLLQSIELCFNPHSIERWENSVNYLVNSKSDSATISTSSTGRQLSLDNYTESENDSGVGSNELGIRSLRDSETLDAYVQVIRDLAQKSPESNYYLDRFSGTKLELDDQFSELNRERFEEDIQTGLQEAIITACQDADLEEINESAIMLIVNGEEYPFVYLDDSFYDDLRREISTMAARRVVTRITQIEKSIDDMKHELVQDFRRMFSDLLIPRFSRGRFVEDPPKISDDVIFTETVKLSEKDVDLKKNQRGIRLNRIEEYIISHNLLPNLTDLSLDTLVFEDEEEYQVPYGFMGDGFQQYINVLWQLFRDDLSNKVLLLEEAENHMHPGYIDKLVYTLIDMAMEKDIQLFITSHNVDFLDAFFSQNLSEAERNYLKEEFRLLKMKRTYEEQLSYSQAQAEMETIHSDLRGI
jgi:AAA15 family ATPase/GTPase